MTAPAPQVGEVVAGKYRIERPLGEGGMAVVYAATHLGLGRPVALKFVRPWSLGESEVRQRFMREAQATFSLRSEHAVRMLDLGELPSGDLFLVMELLQGQNLAEHIKERGMLPELDAALYVRQACDALAEAHALGIVHRDLKPANLFLTQTPTGRPSLKVLDFGLAKIAGTVGPGSMAPLTNVATTLGTPKYMAPEQWERARHVDGRADIFSLGVILFQMLTSRVPHEELPLDERVRMILAGAVPSPRQFNPNVGETMARIVMRCLRPIPEERFATAEELASALAKVGVSAGPMSRPAVSFNATGITAVVPDAVKRAVQHEVQVHVGNASNAAASVAMPQVAMPAAMARGNDDKTRIERAVPMQSPAPALAPGTQRMPLMMDDGMPESVRTEKMDRPAFMEGVVDAPAPAPAQPAFGRTMMSNQAPSQMPAQRAPAQQVSIEPPRVMSTPPPGTAPAGMAPMHAPPHSGMSRAYAPPPMSQAQPMSTPMSRAYVPPKKSSGVGVFLVLLGVFFVVVGVIGAFVYVWYRQRQDDIAPAPSPSVSASSAAPVLLPVVAPSATGAELPTNAGTKKKVTTSAAARPDAGVATDPVVDSGAAVVAPQAAAVAPSTPPPSPATVAPTAAGESKDARPVDAGAPSKSAPGRSNGKGRSGGVNLGF